MNIRPLAKGLLTFIPGMPRVLRARATGGTDCASYCYAVWLKHLTLLWENGMRSIPKTLAELGPGDSLGVGLAAMLCGVDRYFALDVVRHSCSEINLKIFDELVALFRSRAARPAKGWPDFDKYLDDQLFPSHILRAERLAASLSEKRIESIRSLLEHSERRSDAMTIQYMVPWTEDSVIAKESVDVILSHSVLEHVVDIEKTYQALHSWLKPNGMMSHQIDFASHGLSETWNGYRAHSELLWKMMMGKRPYMINREPHSAHIDLMVKNGFRIICDLTTHRTDGIQRSELSDHWKGISEEDLTCSEAFIQARK